MTYAFLSQPPPQKKRPTHPPPRTPVAIYSPVPISVSTTATTVTTGRKRSSTITAWISQVQPGSPAPISPLSPISRRSSNRSTRSYSLCTISSTTQRDFKGALLTQGYTSFVVQLPRSALDSQSAPKKKKQAKRPSSPKTASKKPLNRLRSLSFKAISLKVKSENSITPTKMSTAVTPTQVSAPKSSKSKSKPKSKSGSSSTSRQRYAHLIPIPLTAEVQLSQLLDGGTTNKNVKRVMHTQAKSSGVPQGAIGGGVGDAYRDGEGGLWLDEEEQWEFAHLMEGSETPTLSAAASSALIKSPLRRLFSGHKGDDSSTPVAADWVEFGAGGEQDEERRGSCASQDSDLDPKYALVADGDNDLDAFGGALDSRCVKPGVSVLALPRPRRTAKHMNKPAFILDAFSFTTCEKNSSATCFKATYDAPGSPQERARGKARRRPAPLTLLPPSPTRQKPINLQAMSPPPPMAVTIAVERKRFIEDSFAPTPVSAGLESLNAVANAKVGAKSRTFTVGKAKAKDVSSKEKEKTGAAAARAVRGIFKSLGGQTRRET